MNLYRPTCDWVNYYISSSTIACIAYYTALRVIMDLTSRHRSCDRSSQTCEKYFRLLLSYYLSRICIK